MSSRAAAARPTPSNRASEIERLRSEGLRPSEGFRPGMPADLFVKTGERTMANYLFKPVIDRAQTAISED